MQPATMDPQQQQQWMAMNQQQQQQLQQQMYTYNNNNQQPPAAAGDEIRTLWIGDLQYRMDEHYLLTSFAQTGEVLYYYYYCFFHLFVIELCYFVTLYLHYW